MRFVLTPDWFLGKDVMIEGFSFLVLFGFFFLCRRYYKLSNKKPFSYLGTGFLLIAIAQLATITTKLILYYDTTFTQQIGQMIVTYHILKTIDFMYYFGFFFHKILTLVGLYVIYRLPMKKSSGDWFLAGYFILISALVGTDINFIFNITVLVFLGLIIKNYYSIYKKNHSSNTGILMLAFSILFFGHLLYVIPELCLQICSPGSVGSMAVTANILELFSFSILFFLMIRILKFHKNENGKKKK